MIYLILNVKTPAGNERCCGGKESWLKKKPQSFKISDINLQGPVLEWWDGCRAWEKCLCVGCTCRTLHADIHAEGKQGVSHAAICRLCTSKHPLPCRNAGLEGHDIHVPAVKNWNDEPHTVRHPPVEVSAFIPTPIISANQDLTRLQIHGKWSDVPFYFVPYASAFPVLGQRESSC